MPHRNKLKIFCFERLHFYSCKSNLKKSSNLEIKYDLWIKTIQNTGTWNAWGIWIRDTTQESQHPNGALHQHFQLMLRPLVTFPPRLETRLQPISPRLKIPGNPWKLRSDLRSSGWGNHDSEVNINSGTIILGALQVGRFNSAAINYQRAANGWMAAMPFSLSDPRITTRQTGTIYFQSNGDLQITHSAQQLI